MVQPSVWAKSCLSLGTRSGRRKFEYCPHLHHIYASIQRRHPQAPNLKSMSTSCQQPHDDRSPALDRMVFHEVDADRWRDMERLFTSAIILLETFETATIVEEEQEG